ncbi:MAG: bifunctional aspartate transaminase/aspartate 4-decarboxylase [Paramuribaculum sp.]|nr:bifunctional aspartate transaminase/aspartate 4-decarboxylase [Bacteroides sp.]MDE7459943.1 bifunctional aspartate transaminase/aspartate 4-decarboxylase [Paramuribaculum sp.]
MIKNPEDRNLQKKLSQMSPFEIKGTLIKLAEKDAQRSTATFLNAGRGNPNWLLTYPRKAFFMLGQFAMEEADRNKFDYDLGIVASPNEGGMAKRFEEFLDKHSDDIAAKVLRHFYTYVTEELKADADDFVYELVDGIIGDHYPTPPRILKYTEIITRDYLRWAMGGGDDKTEYDLFATEGSTAGMCYMFNTLKANHLLKPGDKIALLTPCFTPYLEIPELSEFGLEIVKVSANAVEKDGYHDWQYPKEEIDKLRDPSVKVVCVTNPSNPPSVCLAPDVLEQMVDVVKNDNPELMIITDDVYGTFIKDFKSLMYVLPYNTICLYSYSKYFGATGWRVAAMALRPDNVFDARIAALPAEEKAELDKRYSSLTLTPSKLKFIDRLVADSRLVALNHTAGLSTPQQIQMALFSAFAYLHREELQPKLISMIEHRLDNLWSPTGFKLQPDPYRAGYYSEIDMMVWSKKFYGEEFADYLKSNYEPLDFVIRLANETAIVLLNGDGFDGPEWSVRVSLANLDDSAYLKIGTAIRHILDDYYERFVESKK